jgi:hypothetical protein
MTISGTPLPRHFYGVRVAQLVRGEAAAHAGLCRDVSQLSAHSGV